MLPLFPRATPGVQMQHGASVITVFSDSRDHHHSSNQQQQQNNITLCGCLLIDSNVNPHPPPPVCNSPHPPISPLTPVKVIRCILCRPIVRDATAMADDAAAAAAAATSSAAAAASPPRQSDVSDFLPVPFPLQQQQQQQHEV